MKVAKQERNPQRGGNGASQPITRHPLFPAIVALWFAALFGIGSVLLGATTIERVVAATGLAKVIPMAAPPLGTTARLLVALGLTGIGGLVGALIGLRLAARGASQAEAMGDFSSDGSVDAADDVPAVGRLPGRRRGFVPPMESVAEPESEAITAQPANANIFQLSDLDDDLDPSFDPRAFAPQDADVVAESAEPAPAESAVDLTPASHESSEDAFAEPAHPHLIDAFSPAAWADPAHSVDVADDEEEDEGAPVARLFEAYTRTLEVREAPADVAAEHEQAVSEATEAPAPSLPPASPGAERIAAAPLDDLSHVELLERLALAMEEQRRKLALAQATPLSVVPFAAENAPKDAGDTVSLYRPAPVEPAAQAELDDEPEAEIEEQAPPTPAVAPVLQRLSSLGKTAPFAPPPFAPPPFSARQNYDGVAEADDTPLQPVDDFVSDADESPSIGDWSDSAEATHPEAPQQELAAEEEPEAPVRVPAALRPVGLSGFDEEYDDAVPGYIPPRRIVMPNAPESHDAADRPLAGLAGGHQFTPGEDDEDEETALAEFDDNEFADDGQDQVEEDVLEEGYSSLLNLQRRAEPRPSLIGIDGETSEMDLESGEHSEYPIPVDPATTGEAGSSFAPPPLPGARLFDPPGRPDPAETEKALRAALATLQRMSGAA